MIESFRRWIVQNQLLLWLVMVSAFVRLYQLEPSLMFQGDQGRDAMIVADIFRKHDPVFIGPVTSVGNMYLGPLYYYFMLPFLFLTYPSPIGPALGVALVGILTTVGLVILGKRMVGTRAAYIAAFLYTISATAVLYSRFSWNPNPAPFVSLLLLFSTWQALRKPQWWWLVGVWSAVLLQLHYITLLGIGAVGLIWIWQAVVTGYHQRSKNFWIGSALAGISVLLSFVPLILFDSKHNWLNASAFMTLLTGDTFTPTASVDLWQKIWVYSKETDGRSRQIIFDHLLGNQQFLNRILLASTVIALIKLYKNQTALKRYPALSLIVWYLGIGIIGTSLYQHSVFDHYILYLLPAAYLLLGLLLDWLSRLLPLGRWVVGAALLGVLSYNLGKLPLKPTGWQVTDIQATSQSILERVKPGELYNIVLLSESRDLDGQNYRYFLTTKVDAPPVPPEKRAEVETLFIINETHTSNVVNLPVYEIVTFPNHMPDEVYQIPQGPEITVLRR